MIFCIYSVSLWQKSGCREGVAKESHTQNWTILLSMSTKCKSFTSIHIAVPSIYATTMVDQTSSLLDCCVHSFKNASVLSLPLCIHFMLVLMYSNNILLFFKICKAKVLLHIGFVQSWHLAGLVPWGEILQCSQIWKENIKIRSSGKPGAGSLLNVTESF